MSGVCCNKEHILKYHMILWQRWDHGSSSVANYQILNCRFDHFINYCDFIWLSQISFVCVNQILWNPYLVLHIINATSLVAISHIQHPLHHHHHSRLWPSPSITNIIIITITIMVFFITLSILEWIILYSMLCVPSLWVCEIVFKHIPSLSQQKQYDSQTSCTLTMHGPVSLCNCSWWHLQV